MPNEYKSLVKTLRIGTDVETKIEAAKQKQEKKN
jgi:hypothetical protein